MNTAIAYALAIALVLCVGVPAKAQHMNQMAQGDLRTAPPQTAPRHPPTVGGLTAKPGGKRYDWCCSTCPQTGEGSGCQPAAGGPGSCPSGLGCFLSCTNGETARGGGVICH